MPKGDAVSIPIESFAADVAFGTTGLYATAYEAVAAFRKAPKDVAKVFIVTGNSMYRHRTVLYDV